MNNQRNERLDSDQYTKVADFEEKFRIQDKNDKGIKSTLSSLIRNQVKNYSLKKSIRGHFPVIETFRTYKWKKYLIKDFLSGLMSGFMMIPLGLAYASISTLPPIIGLYMSFFASITYFVFGTSRHLSWGCVATASLMVANIMIKYDNSDEAISFIASLNNTLTETNTVSTKVSYSNFQDSNTISSLNVGEHGGGELEHAVSASLTNETKNNILDAINARRIEVGSSIAVVTGLILVLEALIGLSRFTSVMSNSLIEGFTVGVAFNVATSQLNGFLGLSVKRYSGNFWAPRTWVAIVKHIQETNLAVFIIASISLLIMYLVKRCVNEKYKHRLKIPIHIEMLVVILAIVVTKFNYLDQIYDVEIVGDIPVGIPKPKFPDVMLIFNYSYIADASLIALIVHVQALALAKKIAIGGSRSIRYDQEMLAAGMCSVVCGVFSGYIPGAYIPISTDQRDSGGVSQLASLFAAGIVILVVMFMSTYFYSLPNCVISAIVLINLRPLFMKLCNLPEKWKKSKFDFTVWIFACAVTVVLEIGNAFLLSVGFSIFLVLLRSMVNPVIEVVPIQIDQKSSLLLRPTGQYISAKTLLSIRLIQLKADLYFFNSDSFVAAVFEKTKTDRIHPILLDHRRASKTSNIEMPISDSESLSASVKNEVTPLISSSEKMFPSLITWKTLIIDISQVSFMDTMGMESLEFIIKKYKSMGIKVLITSVPDNIFGILRSTGFWNKYRDILFIDVQSALDSISSTTDDSQRKNKSEIIPQNDQWV